VSLKNSQVANPSSIQYTAQVIPDRFPQVSVDRIQDTITYNYIALSGLVSDDYGFSKLRLNYSIKRNGKSSPTYSKDIPINRSTTSKTLFTTGRSIALNLDRRTAWSILFRFGITMG
jgi:hypothetical protein